MTVEEFYKAIDESFEDMMSRFLSKDRIRKYILMFLNDNTFEELTRTLNEKDYETAFRMVHTLKGVSSNLGFTKLFDSSVVLTEILRAKKYEMDLNTPYQLIKKEYEKIIEALKQVE